MLTFKPDYRNRIRKAPKKGVEVKVMGTEALDDFVRIMRGSGTTSPPDRKAILSKL